MSQPVDQARLLLPAAQKLAAAAFGPLSEQYPELAAMLPELPAERWQFFFVVTSVGITFLLAPGHLAASNQDEICQIVSAALTAWHPQAHDALQDFFAFIHQRLEQEVELPAAIGTWLLWNLKQAKPTVSELELAWPLGLFFLHSFKDWWDLASPEAAP